MFGSLMMLASGVLASSPSSARSSGCRRSAGRRSGNAARMRPASEMSRVSTAMPGRLREGLDDRQQRVGGEGRRFVGVGVDDLGCAHVSPGHPGGSEARGGSRERSIVHQIRRLRAPTVGSRAIGRHRRPGFAVTFQVSAARAELASSYRCRFSRYCPREHSPRCPIPPRRSSPSSWARRPTGRR